MQAKNCFLIGLLLFLCLPSMHAYSIPDYISRISTKTFSLHQLFMYGTIYPYMLDYLYQQVEDIVVWQKGSVSIHAHEIGELFMRIALDILYAAVCGLRDEQLQEHMVLTLYGALLHKCLQQLIYAFRLHDCVSDQTVQQYRLYGSSYVKALLACMCNEYVNPMKYQ